MSKLSILINKIKKNFFLIFGINILFLKITFFSILSILSIEYAGSDESNLYIYVIAVSSFIFYFLFFKRILLRKIISTEPIFIAIGILVLINAFFVSFILDIPVYNFIYQFFLIVLPSMLFGMELGLKHDISSVKRLFLIVSFIVTICVVLLIPKMLQLQSHNLLTFFGGGQYQAFSYAVSLTYILLFIYFNFYLENKKNIIKFFFISIFLIQIFGIVLSGGRGGIGVVILGTLWVLLIKYPLFKLIKNIVIIIVISSLFGYFILNYFENFNERIFESSARLFSFVSEDGFDFEKTSNRDVVYLQTYKIITKSPVYGYGFFGYLEHTNFAYPHNFFLEILLQGGILLFLFVIGFFFIYIKKLFRLLSHGKKHLFLLGTFSFSFVHLMFSGTYILEPFFWFNLAYVLTVSKKIRINKLI